MCRLDNIGPKSPASELTGLKRGEAGPEKLSEEGEPTLVSTDRYKSGLASSDCQTQSQVS